MTGKLLPLLIGATAMLASPAAAAERRTPDEQLARALQGRVAGEPVQCLNLRTIRASRVIPNTALIYEQGGTLYVNRPRAGADSLNRWDAQVVRSFNNRLCTNDTIRIVDQTSGFMTGLVFLGDFVPYRRVSSRD